MPSIHQRLDEHRAVRESLRCLWPSHGRFFVHWRWRRRQLDSLHGNRLARLSVGKARVPPLMLNERGGRHRRPHRLSHRGKRIPSLWSTPPRSTRTPPGSALAIWRLGWLKTAAATPLWPCRGPRPPRFLRRLSPVPAGVANRVIHWDDLLPVTTGYTVRAGLRFSYRPGRPRPSGTSYWPPVPGHRGLGARGTPCVSEMCYQLQRFRPFCPTTPSGGGPGFLHRSGKRRFHRARCPRRCAKEGRSSGTRLAAILVTEKSPPSPSALRSPCRRTKSDRNHQRSPLARASAPAASSWPICRSRFTEIGQPMPLKFAGGTLCRLRR